MCWEGIVKVWQKQLRPSCQGHPPKASKHVISQQLLGCSGLFCVFVGLGDYVTSTAAYCSVNATLFISLCFFHYFAVNLLMSLCECHNVDITMLTSLCWCLSVDEKRDVVEQHLHCITNASTNMTKTTQPILPATSTWSLKTCHISTAGSAINGRHCRVLWWNVQFSPSLHL